MKKARLLSWESIQEGKTLSAGTVFSTETPDLKSLIDALDMMEDYQRNALIEGMHEAGDIIVEEQRRLIRNKSNRLANAIDREGVGTYKRQKVFNPVTLEKDTRQAYYVRCGYLEDAFETDAHGFNPGIIGTMYEFGRPGKSDATRRQSKTVRQKRKRRKKIPVSSKRKNAKGWKYSEAEPTEVEINKGLIVPVPHIRRGFDNVVEKAAEAVANKVEQALEKAWNEDYEDEE